MPSTRFPLLLTLLHTTLAAQPSAPSPIAAPLRELPWGQLNFLHTTDTHGWHGGHLQEAQYSADWGDTISFASHLRKRADADGSDLLLIDTGDRVEGNGLYDASNPKGRYTFDILKEQSIDVMTSGNHELYLANTSRNEYEVTVPDFRGSYLASNVDLYKPESDAYEALAPRYRKFTTQNQGIRVLAMGFLYNFHGNANNTRVIPVQETIQEKWFQDAIHDRNVDLFLIAGHVPVRDSEEYDLIYKAIRGTQWDTPIVFLGGHTHIRDYRKFDKKAYGLESGRYMETLGIMSVSGLNTGGKTGDLEKVATQLIASPKFERRYIDNNLFSLHHHSDTNSTTFPTDLGLNVSKAIRTAREHLKLDHTFGCAPRDYWLNRAPYPSNGSLLTLLEEDVIPDTFNNATSLKDRPAVIITNSGAMRFDIFKGAFTTDTTFLVSPFTSGFRMIKDVPYAAASQILGILNNEGSILPQALSVPPRDETVLRRRLWELAPPLPPATTRSRAGGASGVEVEGQVPLGGGDGSKPQLPGYTTVDDAGNDGDDTLHQPIQFYDVPNCIGVNIGFPPPSAPPASEAKAETESKPGEFKKDRLMRFGSTERQPASYKEHIGVRTPGAPEKVDVIYNEFIEDGVISVLRYLGHKYDREDTEMALGGKSMTDVLREWVGGHWGCEG